jgi:uncharacterized membrane protein YeaQ/YmgE (transglycosylase-associated protein family)
MPLGTAKPHVSGQVPLSFRFLSGPECKTEGPRARGIFLSLAMRARRASASWLGGGRAATQAGFLVEVEQAANGAILVSLVTRANIWMAESFQIGGIMTVTALLIALIIGAIAGWLAGLLVQGTGFGLVGDIVVGIIGALIAGALFPLLGVGLTMGGGLVGAIVAATLGAVILLVVVRLVKRGMH